MLGFIGGGLMAEPNPKELFDQGKEILNFAVSGGGGAFRGDSLEAKKYYIQAKEYFEKACGLNNGRGCNGLGVLYRDGQGVEKNLTKVAYFYSKACKLGFQKTCEILKELR
nr:sel1 repeat family protein [Helicobacter pylori]